MSVVVVHQKYAVPDKKFLQIRFSEYGIGMKSKFKTN